MKALMQVFLLKCIRFPLLLQIQSKLMLVKVQLIKQWVNQSPAAEITVIHNNTSRIRRCVMYFFSGKSNTSFAYDVSMINISLKKKPAGKEGGEWLYRVWWKARRGLAIDIFNNDYIFTHIFKSNHEFISLVCDVYGPKRPTCFFFFFIVFTYSNIPAGRPLMLDPHWNQLTEMK